MNIERRASHVSEVRAVNDSVPGFEAVVMNYGVLDDYDTIFDAGCFTKSLEARLPRDYLGHDWTDAIGRYVDYKDTPEQLILIGEFDDFDAVPRARQAYAELQSGTIDQFSVGFHRIATREDEDHRTHFTEAGLDEVALVLVGAVPKTELLSTRSIRTASGLVVPEDLVVTLGKKLAAGEITLAEAQAATLIASELQAATPIPPPVIEPPDVSADADTALEALGF